MPKKTKTEALETTTSKLDEVYIAISKDKKREQDAEEWAENLLLIDD